MLDVVKSMVDNCSLCLEYTKPKSRPTVEFSLAQDFNETVAMDLNHFRIVYILHLIDHTTKFCVAAIIHSKCKEVIIDKIFKHWIALFGAPNFSCLTMAENFTMMFLEKWVNK